MGIDGSRQKDEKVGIIYLRGRRGLKVKTFTSNDSPMQKLNATSSRALSWKLAEAVVGISPVIGISDSQHTSSAGWNGSHHACSTVKATECWQEASHT